MRYTKVYMQNEQKRHFSVFNNRKHAAVRFLLFFCGGSGQNMVQCIRKMIRGYPEIMSEDFITMTIGKQKNIALIAHDNKKADLIDWCEQNKEILKQHFLCGTGTTARMITDQTGLPVRGYNSGPLGGDQQIGAKIVEGRVDFVIFFSDPLTAQPHDPDVKALLRIAQVYDIPIANNRASADFMIHSTYMNTEYEHEIINFKKNIKERSETL